jgi:hypothetical protein
MDIPVMRDFFDGKTEKINIARASAPPVKYSYGNHERRRGCSSGD